MKAISLTQPWATLVAIGAKRIETRSWRTDYRGPLAIHASKGFPVWARTLCREEPFRSALADAGIEMWAELPRGEVVAICTLTGCPRIRARSTDGTPCITTLDSLLWRVPSPEREFGDYSYGRWAWLLKDVEPLAKPIPAIGTLGLWEWKDPR